MDAPHGLVSENWTVGGKSGGVEMLFVYCEKSVIHPHPAFGHLLPHREKESNRLTKKARWPSARPTGFRESYFSIRGDGRGDVGVRLRVHCALLHADLVRRALCAPCRLEATAAGHHPRRRVVPAGHRHGRQILHGCHRPCLLYTSPSPRDRQKSRMPSSA